jgi:hypothetical protein
LATHARLFPGEGVSPKARERAFASAKLFSAFQVLRQQLVLTTAYLNLSKSVPFLVIERNQDLRMIRWGWQPLAEAAMKKTTVRIHECP